MSEIFQPSIKTGTASVYHGNNIDILRRMPDCSVDSIVTDPPYELGFMGKKWDSSGIAYSVELWSECLRVLKHGGHLLAFSGSRTYHRMVVAIEDAGFEIRDQIMWVYGSGFPKSMDISKAIDKQAGAEREVIGSKVTGKALDKASRTGEFADGNHGGQQVVEVTAPATAAAKTWQGWGTALKPAHEPIVMARKPVDGTVANNVLKHGVGGINIDDCRVGMSEEDFAKLSAGVEAIRKRGGTMENSWKNSSDLSGANPANAKGRFPANFIHDGSDEVLALTGDAGRFFYCAKASKAERNAGLEGLPAQRHADRTVDDGVGGDNPRNRTNTAKQNFHPTVKPITLMRYLVRLVTPHNGTVLDPFAGSGSTLVAATLEGFECVGMELMDDYLPIIEARLNWADNQETETPSLFD